MAGKIQFKIDPFYTKGAVYQHLIHGEMEMLSTSEIPYKYFPHVQIDVDSIVSVGSITKQVPLTIPTGNTGPKGELETITKNVLMPTDVILFVKDFSYNNGIAGQPANAARFFMSNEKTLQEISRKVKDNAIMGKTLPESYFKDYACLSEHCLNKKYNLLDAVVKAIESHPGEGVINVSVGVDPETLHGDSTAAPQPVSFNAVHTAFPGDPGMEDPNPGEVNFTPCLDELAVIAQGFGGEGQDFISEQAGIILESGNEEQACELLAMMQGAG